MCVLVYGESVGSLRVVWLLVARSVFAVMSFEVAQVDEDRELCITLFPTLAASLVVYIRRSPKLPTTALASLYPTSSCRCYLRDERIGLLASKHIASFLHPFYLCSTSLEKGTNVPVSFLHGDERR